MSVVKAIGLGRFWENLLEGSGFGGTCIISYEIIDEVALEIAIEMSGGLIRDMFTLLSEAAVTAGVASREKITVADVDKAVMTLEERYVRVIEIENGFDEIIKISKDSYRQVDKNLRELLRAEVVLEYSNNRYLVHPVVLKFFKTNWQRG